MDWTDILVMLHLWGFGAGIAGAAVGTVFMRHLAANPTDASVLARVQPTFARVGQIGLAVLWITGPWLVATKYGGFGALPWTFWVKFLCVVGVTAAVIMLDLWGRRARAGDAQARAQLPLIGMASGILLLLVLVFAVLTFH